MKKLILYSFIACTMLSCKKDHVKVYCWECSFSDSGFGNNTVVPPDSTFCLKEGQAFPLFFDANGIPLNSKCTPK